MKLKSMQERFLKSKYLDKGTRFSVSTLTKPNYQLWVSNQLAADDGQPKEDITGFKSAIGTAWHSFVEQDNEAGVIKEFTYVTEHNGITIGGTADELMWLPEKGTWQIRDHKTKGVYSAKKFLGVGTKANPNPPPDNEKEILQLSIYRWLFKDLFKNIDDEAVIYLWVMGHTKREQFPEVSEVPLKLIPLDQIEVYVDNKLQIASSTEAPAMDCNLQWMCDYCNVRDNCPDYQDRHAVSFGDER